MPPPPLAGRANGCECCSVATLNRRCTAPHRASSPVCHLFQNSPYFFFVAIRLFWLCTAQRFLFYFRANGEFRELGNARLYLWISYFSFIIISACNCVVGSIAVTVSVCGVLIKLLMPLMLLFAYELTGHWLHFHFHSFQLSRQICAFAICMALDYGWLCVGACVCVCLCVSCQPARDSKEEKLKVIL